MPESGSRLRAVQGGEEFEPPRHKGRKGNAVGEMAEWQWNSTEQQNGLADLRITRRCRRGLRAMTLPAFGVQLFASGEDIGIQDGTAAELQVGGSGHPDLLTEVIEVFRDAMDLSRHDGSRFLF